MAVPYYNVILALRAETQRRKLQRRCIRDSSNPFEIPDNEFAGIFRISKDIAMYICNALGEELRPLNPLGLPVHYKVLTSVKLLADGNYQRGTGQDHTICIGQTTVSKYLRQFIKAVIKVLLPIWIKFPGTEEERHAIASQFHAKFGLPDILGAIDCTQVDIFPPDGLNKIQFLNRKRRYTFNVQLVVDSECKILHINSRYPGRVHDQFIFNNSNIKDEMKRLHSARIGKYYLLGDSGYALEPWLMTPILDAAPGSPEEQYTKWHCASRNVVERTNGRLKGTFRCLGIDRSLHYAPENAASVIYASAVLYNIMLYFRFPVLENDIPQQREVDMNFPDLGNPLNLLRQGEARRREIVNTHFNN